MHNNVPCIIMSDLYSDENHPEMDTGNIFRAVMDSHSRKERGERYVIYTERLDSTPLIGWPAAIEAIRKFDPDEIILCGAYYAGNETSKRDNCVGLALGEIRGKFDNVHVNEKLTYTRKIMPR